ncbi:MAG TPA: hypothetical protein VKZ74_08765 [Natronosporangium sp.]|nr:hypothetical protein [Natronosporangium sp.]
MIDERARHRRRLRRLRGAVRRWTVTAGGLAATSAVLLPYQGLGPWDAVWAGLTGASAVFAWWRWSDLRELAAQPEPPPLDPAQAGERWLAILSQLPGGYSVAEGIRRQRVRGGLRGSEAAEVWERLDRCARTMRELTSRLGGSDPEAVREAGRVERELRELTDRIISLERAMRVAPAEAQAPLRELRDDHLSHLRTGVAAYEEFVVAAASFVAESARAGEPAPMVTGLTDATDRLRGVTAGLSELRRLYGDLRVTG